MKKSQLAAALALTSCMVIGASAVSGSPWNVTATFRPDITLRVNGSAYTVFDSKGNEVAPLLYEGTTYLPLASLGRTLGVQVSWDEATKTVTVSGQASTQTQQPSTTTQPQQTGTTTPTQQTGSLIGEARAKEIALQHAGLSNSQVSFIRSHLDWEHGRQVYDVEFYSGNKEYDYEIDAYSGAIYSYDFDIEGYVIPSGTQQSSGTQQTGTMISEARAKEIALQHAGLSSSQATFIRSHLDWDHGRQVYDVEFWSGNTEYDYEIDAYSGSVLSYDFDVEGYMIPQQQSGNYISQEKARQLAQAKAPNATLVKLQFEFDDGRAVYEGELREGFKEYEFKIDAVSGAFLQWEQDWG